MKQLKQLQRKPPTVHCMCFFHRPVEGNYTTWSDWTSCSTTCGVGIKMRNRTCANPTPQFGGKSCEEQGLGLATEAAHCYLRQCAGLWTVTWSEFACPVILTKENEQTFHMSWLLALGFVLCSRDVDVLRAQRIIGFFILITHKSTRSENWITWWALGQVSRFVSTRYLYLISLFEWTFCRNLKKIVLVTSPFWLGFRKAVSGYHCQRLDAEH